MLRIVCLRSSSYFFLSYAYALFYALTWLELIPISRSRFARLDFSFSSRTLYLSAFSASSLAFFSAALFLAAASLLLISFLLSSAAALLAAYWILSCSFSSSERGASCSRYCYGYILRIMHGPLFILIILGGPL